MDMPELGGEVRQQPLYIGAFLIPRHQPMNSPWVAQVVKAGVIAWALVAEDFRLLTQPSEDARGLLAGNGSARAAQQERRLGSLQCRLLRSLMGIGGQRVTPAWTAGYPARLVKLAGVDG